MTLLNHLDDDGDRLMISADEEGKALVGVKSGPNVAVVEVDAIAAPAVALAILDGAGLVPDHPGLGPVAEGKLYAAAALLQEAVLDAAERGTR
ncbi:hypothetical protein SEA_BERRIE_54 [Arthrobacter phage Berrie]|uniref:Uncharacterized protein n=1 Tax=Arthrobacter phage Berrie TaxID=2926087 RepID=A0ABZ2CMF3_9CAUD